MCLPFLVLLAVVCHHRPGRRRGPTRARSHSHARPCRHAALAQTCTPARARPSREGEAGPLALFLAPDLATMLRPCRPHRHGLTVEACFAHAVAEKGTPSFLVGECTPRHRPSLPHTRLCPTTVTLSAATLWRRPELRHGLRRLAALQPTPGLSLSRSHPYARVHPSARTRTQVRAHPHQSGRPDRLPRTAAAPTPPCRPRCQPRRADHLLPRSFSFEPQRPEGIP
jgi:hypothetical protein